MEWIGSGSLAAVDPHMGVLLNLALIVTVSDLVVPAMVMEFAGRPPISPSEPSMENLLSYMFEMHRFWSSVKTTLSSAIVWLLISLLFIIIEVVTSHNYYNYLTYITISY
jgi:hypothetical protein